MARVVTAVRLPAAAAAVLEPLGTLGGPERWPALLGDAEALLSLVTTRVDADLLSGARRLRIVANIGVGFDNIDRSACRERGIVVTNTPGVLTDATADLAVALMLATVRRLPAAEATLRRGDFHGWGFWDHLGGDLAGAVVGIFGMGRIGQAVARRLAGFGVKLQYHSRTRLEASSERELAATWVEWEALLTTSDILTLHAPYDASLHHLLDLNSLRRMRRGSYLVNTARGAMIDEAALVEVLRHGPLAGAGLDVYEAEPSVHPGLLASPNVVLLPHIGSATIGTRTAMAVLAAKNVASVLTGGLALTPIA